MLTFEDISVVVPTRGDVPMLPVLESFPFWEIVIWDNSKREDLGVYGRYAAIELAHSKVIFTQDDDCVLSPAAFAALIAAYKPGHLIANMPQEYRDRYTDSCLIGFGALFDRELPTAAFERYERHYPLDRPTSDVVFTALTPRVLVDEPIEYLPWTRADNRMYRQPGHSKRRATTLTQARKVRERP